MVKWVEADGGTGVEFNLFLFSSFPSVIQPYNRDVIRPGMSTHFCVVPLDLNPVHNEQRRVYLQRKVQWHTNELTPDF